MPLPVFDPLDHPHASRRQVVYARRGMACAGNPTAASVGLQTLLKGGNAVDAAVAMAAVMPLVEPTGNGLGSDAFVLIWKDGRLYGINGSGPSPLAATLDAYRARGFTEVPAYGVLSADVPGCVAAWAEVAKRFGRMDFKDVLAPAVDYARRGFAVSPTVSLLWARAEKLYSKFRADPQFEPWFEHFAPAGRAPKAGEVFSSADMARTLELIAATEGRALYKGVLAERTAEFFEAKKGLLTY